MIAAMRINCLCNTHCVFHDLFPEVTESGVIIWFSLMQNMLYLLILSFFGIIGDASIAKVMWHQVISE
jgi:hypothetical protein